MKERRGKEQRIVWKGGNKEVNNGGKLKREQKELAEKIEVAKEKIEIYNNKIDTLEDDFQREAIARNRLQMIKESEEIYRFIKH